VTGVAVNLTPLTLRLDWGKTMYGTETLDTILLASISQQMMSNKTVDAD
jgi:hypothetical protein